MKHLLSFCIVLIVVELRCAAKTLNNYCLLSSSSSQTSVEDNEDGVGLEIDDGPKCSISWLTLEGSSAPPEDTPQCLRVKSDVFRIIGNYQVLALNCTAPYLLDLDYDGFYPTEAVRMYFWREARVTMTKNGTNYTISTPFFGLDVTITSIQSLHQLYRRRLNYLKENGLRNQFFHQNLSTPILQARTGKFTIRGMHVDSAQFRTSFYFFFEEPILTNEPPSFIQNEWTHSIKIVADNKILVPCRPSKFLTGSNISLTPLALHNDSSATTEINLMISQAHFDPTIGFELFPKNMAITDIKRFLSNTKFQCSFKSEPTTSNLWTGSWMSKNTTLKNTTEPFYGLESWKAATTTIAINSKDSTRIDPQLSRQGFFATLKCDVTFGDDEDHETDKELFFSTGYELRSFPEFRFRTAFVLPAFAQLSYFVQVGLWDEKSGHWVIDRDRSLGVAFCSIGRAYSITQYAGSPWTNTLYPYPPGFPWFQQAFHAINPAQHINLTMTDPKSSEKIYDRTNLTFRCSIKPDNIMRKPIFWFTRFANDTLNLVFEDEARVADDTFSTLRTTLAAEVVEIFCLGSLWQSDYWRKASMPLKLRVGTQAVVSSKRHLHKFPVNSQNKRIHCEASGDPIPNVWWKKDGKAITSTSGVGSANFEFGTITPDTFGEYVCVAKNIYGKQEVVFQVKQGDKVTSDDNDSSTALGVGLTLLFLLILGTIALFLYLRSKSKGQILTADELRDFQNGVTIGGGSGGGENDQNQYSQALTQPYRPEFEIPSHQFSVDEKSVLGSGAFGLVLKGSVKGKPVAVKTMKPGSGKVFLKALLSELKIFIYLGAHPNLLELVGASTTNLRRGIVYVFVELCDLGSLLSFLKTHRQNFLNQSSSQQMYSNVEGFGINLLHRWALEIAQGMAFLTFKKVIHGDLAARNVLLTSDRRAKITDFGLSRQLYENSMYMKQSQEPLPWRWLALETLMDLKFTCESDVWSYGVTLWEIYSLGQVPFPGLSWDVEFVEGLKNGRRLNCPSMISNELYSTLMTPCWANEAEDRPTFDQICTILGSAKLAH